MNDSQLDFENGQFWQESQSYQQSIGYFNMMNHPSQWIDQQLKLEQDDYKNSWQEQQYDYLQQDGYQEKQYDDLQQYDYPNSLQLSQNEQRIQAAHEIPLEQNQALQKKYQQKTLNMLERHLQQNQENLNDLNDSMSQHQNHQFNLDLFQDDHSQKSVDDPFQQSVRERVQKQRATLQHRRREKYNKKEQKINKKIENKQVQKVQKKIEKENKKRIDNKQLKNKTENKKKKEGEKVNKILNGLTDVYYYPPQEDEQNELMTYLKSQIIYFKFNKDETVQEFWEKMKEVRQKFNDRELGTSQQDIQFMVQATMLVYKYLIQMKNIDYFENNRNITKDDLDEEDIDWLKLITQFIRNAINQAETFKAWKQIYLILNDQDVTEQINWEEVIKKLRYQKQSNFFCNQFDVNKNFYKSHCCAYHNHYKDYDDQYKKNDRYFDEIWFNQRNGKGNCKAGKKQFLEAIKRGRIKNFTIYYYLTYHLKNKKSAEPSIIYLDDLYNLIPKEF